jgi:hypothetical protein
MDQTSGAPRATLAALILMVAMTTGCAGGTPAGPNATSESPSPTISTPAAPARQTPIAAPAAPRRDDRGRHGSGATSPPAAGSLPPDWPADLPIPPGRISGSTGSAGRWTVLILAAGSAAHVRQSTLDLYDAAGFTPVSDSVLNRGNRQITLAVENRDHSNTVTNLVIAVTTS